MSTTVSVAFFFYPFPVNCTKRTFRHSIIQVSIKPLAVMQLLLCDASDIAHIVVVNELSALVRPQ